MAILDGEFSLGLFGLNASSGIAMTRVPERWPANWKDILWVATAADKSGFDFILPLSRWRGYGGATNPTNECMETFSFAAALSGITTNITLFATIHVPFVHPTFAARSTVTIDHASGGRFALNIVCGWSLNEFEMFDLWDYDLDDRYAHGAEWVEVFDRMLDDRPFGSFDGQFFRLKDAECRPLSIQRPRPPIMSAAFSKTGREFATSHCDFLFMMHSNLSSAEEQIAKLLEISAAKGRNASIFTIAHVVCRDTDAEAERYYAYFADEMADQDAVTNFAAQMTKSAPLAAKFMEANRIKIAGGAGSAPIVGSPSRVAEQIIAVKEAGFHGIGLSFVNFRDELPFFIEQALPIVKKHVATA